MRIGQFSYIEELLNKMGMPKQKPGQSKQDYGTPPEFLNAVKKFLDIQDFSIDLAASSSNTVCLKYYDEKTNALDPSNTWASEGWAWLNPPYSHIAPWVEKAWLESTLNAKIAMLIPASTGSNWWRNFVHKKALVLLLSGRLTFVGETTPYPKDSALLLYGLHQTLYSNYVIWDWRTGDLL